MVSLSHEVLSEMFLNRPAFAAELLAGPLGIALPEFSEVSLSSAELTTLAPTEFRVDAVVVLKNDHRPVLAILVEIQLGEDNQKRRSWPSYVVNLYARLGCPVVLLVICVDMGTANWSAAPILVGIPDFVLRPVAFGPQAVPVVTDLDEAQRNPELTVLSALAHGNGPDPEPVFDALLAAVDVVDSDHGDLYTDLVLSRLSAAARNKLEAIMETVTEDFPRKTDIFRRRFRAFQAEVRAEGRAEGEAKGEAKALLAVLAARGIDVPETDRERITSSTDTDQLETWVRRAATATKIQDLYA